MSASSARAARDVYKRQAEDPHRQGLCAEGKELQGETGREELYLDFSYRKPVSYTHLDVYKRQS